MLRSLTAMGYLHYNRRKRTYVPTDRVPFLGSWINPPLFENGALPRLVRAIQKRTGQLVLLAARNGDMAQYIHVLNAPAAVEHHIKIGQKRPLATSGVGQVLLSAMQDKDIRRLYHRMNAYTELAGDKTDVLALIDQLTAVRRLGYTFSRNRVVQGYGVIALPVPQSRACQPLSLGIGGHCNILEQLETQIVDVARQELRFHLQAEEIATAERPSIQVPIGLPAVAAAGNAPPAASAA